MVFAGGKTDSKTSGPQIALLMRNMDEQFLKDYSEAVKKAGADKGITVNIQDARSDAANQLTQLDTLLNQGYKYFVIVPCVSELSDQMNAAIQARGGAAAYSNIQPTVSSLRVGKNFFYVSSAEVIAGQMQADLIADYFDANPAKAPGKTLNMLLILGQLGHPAQINREKGLLAQLKTRGYNVNIVERDTANWTPDQSQQKMDVWASSDKGKFNVVAAQNDGMALGAVESLITNGYTKSDTSDGTSLTVPVYGMDATADALNSMKENKLYATVLQDAVGQASTAFDVVYQVATGTYKAGNSAAGTPAAKELDEEPANDPATLIQCYLVPFAKVDKNSAYYKANVK
jgi:ABC-type sugar transport system substrate-binding protein